MASSRIKRQKPMVAKKAAAPKKLSRAMRVQLKKLDGRVDMKLGEKD